MHLFRRLHSWGVDESEPDADGHCTWRLAFEHGSVIYIRSQTVPETGPGANACPLGIRTLLH